jgi:hypothetical protein
MDEMFRPMVIDLRDRMRESREMRALAVAISAVHITFLPKPYS